MEATVAHWKKNGIRFDAILVGYLGSLEAVIQVNEILDTMLETGGKVIVDPAMADHGKLYSGLNQAYAKAMEGLCRRADVVLPNITEAAMMAGFSYPEEIDTEVVRNILTSLNMPNVILTGVSASKSETGFAMYSGGQISFYSHAKIARSYHGTGDLFAACFTGAWMAGKSMFHAAEIAADFTRKSIQNTFDNPAHWYGVKFEAAIPYLIELLYK
jgi:pyridoxine kinase